MRGTTDNQAAVRDADLVVLAVKPQDMATVAAGFAAGFLNLVRAAKKAQAETAAQGPIPSVPDDDDET